MSMLAASAYVVAARQKKIEEQAQLSTRDGLGLNKVIHNGSAGSHTTAAMAMHAIMCIA